MLRHAAADLGAQHHALARTQAAHGLRVVGERISLDPRHFDRGRPAPAPLAPRRPAACRGAALAAAAQRRCAGLVLVPPGGAGGGGDADDGDDGVDGLWMP